VKTLYNWYHSALFNPRYRWWVILGTLIYLLSPLDISPDIFPIAGQIDDFMILTLLLSEVFKMISQALQAPEIEPPTTRDAGDENSTTIDVEAVSVD
jgi:uncharacterized membrane protein YkvA (DUF1232 family)